VIAAVGPPPTLLYLLSIVGTSGLVAVLWQAYLRWKRGDKEDDELVSRISAQVAEGSAKLLEEYRIELEVAQRQIRLYLDQVTELNRLLGSANERISRLENLLSQRSDDRKDLERQLREAIKRRDKLLQEMEDMRRRISELEREHKLDHTANREAREADRARRESGSD